MQEDIRAEVEELYETVLKEELKIAEVGELPESLGDDIYAINKI